MGYKKVPKKINPVRRELIYEVEKNLNNANIKETNNVFVIVFIIIIIFKFKKIKKYSAEYNFNYFKLKKIKIIKC